MRIARAVALLAFLAAPSLVSAHDMAKGANGGQVADDSGHHVEFITKDGQVLLFLSDNADKPISSAKATGRAIIQDGAKQSTVDLIATDPNMLTAKLAAPLTTGAKIVISIKLGDGHDVKARFVEK